MEGVNEKELLKEMCEEIPAEAKLIQDLLRINKDKSLQMRKRGIKDEVEQCINKLVNSGKL